MNLQVVYCTYRSTDLAIRDRLSFSSDDDVLRAHDELKRRYPGCEHVVVSTCNRIEVYVAQADAEAGPNQQEIAAFLGEFHGIPMDEFFDVLLREEGPGAVKHLFEVAAGVDSMVLGESQIVQQVKKAYELSTRGDASGPVTHALFQRALRVASRTRSETSLGSGRLSVASVAVGEFANAIFDRFADKHVLVIGAGEMARETLRYLRDAGVSHITVVNRSFERGEALAQEFSGMAVPWDDRHSPLANADIVVSATGASVPVLTADDIRRVRTSAEKPLVLLDLGAPRDIEPEAGGVDDGIFLYDVDDLKQASDRNRKKRHREIDRCAKIIDEETESFVRDVYHQATGPIIRDLRSSWEMVAAEELDTLFRRHPELDEKTRANIERSVRRITGRLLHPPLEALRDDANTGHSVGLVDAVRRLFGLES